VATIFLNCTKNTELTPPWFARTFTLVLSTKNELQLDSKIRNRSGCKVGLAAAVTIHHKLKNGQRV